MFTGITPLTANVLIKKCNKGDALSCYKMGDRYRDDSNIGSTWNGEAIMYYQRACDSGYTKGCIEAANMQVKRGYTRSAIANYDIACFRGDLQGCMLLGTMYLNGDGVLQNYFKARDYFKLGCEGTQGIACYQLGSLYLNGHGVRKDILMAKKYYQKACDYGEQKGCTDMNMSAE